MLLFDVLLAAGALVRAATGSWCTATVPGFRPYLHACCSCSMRVLGVAPCMAAGWWVQTCRYVNSFPQNSHACCPEPLMPGSTMGGCGCKANGSFNVSRIQVTGTYLNQVQLPDTWADIGTLVKAACYREYVEKVWAWYKAGAIGQLFIEDCLGLTDVWERVP